jgi:hypothetical protein
VLSGGDTVAYSSTGVRQGDPLASFYFCLGLHPTLISVRSQYQQEIDLNAYMDDLYIYGIRSEVIKATDKLRDELTLIGLDVNLQKTELLDLSLPTTQNTFGRYRATSEHIRVLGGPVGHNLEFDVGEKGSVKQYVEVSLKESSNLVDKITKNMSAPDAFKLLKNCINTRATYLSRVCHPDILESGALHFDECIDQGIANIVNYSSNLPDHSAIARGLPLKLGGLSIRRVATSCKPAFVSSFISALPTIGLHFLQLLHKVDAIPSYLELISTVIPNFDSISWNHDDEVSVPEISFDTRNCNESLQNKVNRAQAVDKDDIENGEIDQICDGEGTTSGEYTQKELTKVFDKSEYYNLTRKLENSGMKKELSMLKSSRDRYTASWMHSTIAQRVLGHEAFVTALRCRLLLPYQDRINSSDLLKCSQCLSTVFAGDASHHAHSCTLKHIKIKRHNRIRDILASFLRRILPLNSVTTETDIDNRRADIIATVNRSVFVIDVGVCSPSSNEAILAGSAKKPGVAARMMEDEKFATYQSVAENHRTVTVVPFCLEVTGRLGIKAQKFINDITHFTAESPANRDENIGKLRRNLHQLITCECQHWNHILHTESASHLQQCASPAAPLEQDWSSVPDLNLTLPSEHLNIPQARGRGSNNSTSAIHSAQLASLTRSHTGTLREANSTTAHNALSRALPATGSCFVPNCDRGTHGPLLPCSWQGCPHHYCDKHAAPEMHNCRVSNATNSQLVHLLTRPTNYSTGSSSPSASEG